MRSAWLPDALRYGSRWDNHAHRTLPVTSFVMILPIDVPTAPAFGAHAAGVVAPDPALPAPATNAQVAELMDDMLVFQSDTRHTMFGVLLVLGIVAVAALPLSGSLCSSADARGLLSSASLRGRGERR
ncbi:MAG: hypothetical protein IPM22_08480 [Betaproteobacteria bacterium]|nr:hypothetical protein [Betaproteobacteria bacterium]